jgi:hypothetical protein
MIVYAIIAVLLISSLLVGQAIRRLAGLPPNAPLACPLGIAALLTISASAVRLPGHGWTAAAVIVALTVGAFFVAGLESPRRLQDLLLPAGITLALVSLPFLANGRFGPLGVTVNNDLGPHLAWADALRTGNDRLFATIIDGYPIGPHGLTAGLGTLFGTDAERPMAALLMTTPVMVAITALAAFARLPMLFRVVGATVTALAYLPVAYFTQGAFKEPLVALFLLAFALTLREDFPWSWTPRTAVPAAVLGAGAVSAYSFPGLVPLIAAGALAFVGALVLTRPPQWRQFIRPFGASLAASACLLAVLVSPQIPRLLEFSPVEAAVPNPSNPYGGNLVGPLSGYEAFGVWRSPDFRLPPPNAFRAGMESAFALLVAGYGALWLLQRRDPFLPAAAAGAIAVYFYVNRNELPYVSAKVLVIASSSIVALGLLALLSAVAEPRNRTDQAINAGIAVLFVLGAASSSLLVLRHAHVGSLAHARELKTLRPIVADHPTLFLGQDDFAAWELQSAPLSMPHVYAVQPAAPFALRPEKPYLPGHPMDFDTVDPGSLDTFDFVVLPRTAYASVPPANWRRAAETASYEVWRRTDATPHRRILVSERAGPGADLSCMTPEGRRLRRSPGRAGVRPHPVSAAKPWVAHGSALPIDDLGFGHMRPATTAVRTLDLPRGSWEISLQYTSDTSITLRTKGFERSLPANLDRRGPFWSAGSYTSTGGRVTFTITAENVPLSGLAPRDTGLGGLVATRLGFGQQMLPLREACGRYVDWYRPEER